MEIEIQLTATRIEDTPLACVPVREVGAWVEFRGIVRAQEDGKPISGLEYEAYLPMAQAQMHRILSDLATHEPCLSARVIHRIGRVAAGETAIYVGIGARHRAEAFAVLTAFLDRLKRDVPIWKTRALDCSGKPVAYGAPVEEALRCSGQSSFDACTSARTPAEVVALLQTLCMPLEAERVPLSDAGGRCLRESVSADQDQPAFDRSAMDGYALRLDDPSKTLRTVDTIRAGEWKPRLLQRGEAVGIATGGALPEDGLQVVIREHVRVEGDTIFVLRRDKDRNIRFRGEDARAGQVLVEAGTVLEPGTLGLLASVGCTNPWVTRPARVLHVVTGNEIVAPDQRPGYAQIRDSNSTLVRAFLDKWRVLPTQLKVGEDESEVERALQDSSSASPDWDLILISGGASVGEHDFTRRILERGGWCVHVGKTTARPGKPLIVAQRGRTVAVGLPGNPLAHYVCLNLYVRAVLATLAGLPPSAQASFQAGVLAEGLRVGAPARETFWPARWSLRDGTIVLRPLRWTSSGDLTSLATANALIRVGSGVTRLEEGQTVKFVFT